jgi:hypothetical protein
MQILLIVYSHFDVEILQLIVRTWCIISVTVRFALISFTVSYLLQLGV